MQEVLFRERNLRHFEVALFTSLFERLNHALIDIAAGPAQSKEAYAARHAPLRQDIDRLLKRYEAELFEDRYLLAYQRAEAEEERRLRLEALQKAEREAESLKRVASFSGGKTE